MDIIKWIEDWYHSQCDGDWEHTYGVEIRTIDNPGWLIKVNLDGTNLEALKIEYTLIEKSDNDWYGFKVENKVFEAAGDPQKLQILLEKFRQVVLEEMSKV